MKRLRGGRFNFGYQYQDGARGKFSHFRGFRGYFGFMSKYFPFNQGSKRGGRRGGEVKVDRQQIIQCSKKRKRNNKAFCISRKVPQ